MIFFGQTNIKIQRKSQHKPSALQFTQTFKKILMNATSTAITPHMTCVLQTHSFRKEPPPHKYILQQKIDYTCAFSA